MAESNLAICFITAGDINWASSRMRCHWPTAYMENTAIITFEEGKAGLPDADVYVWQKWARPDVMRRQREQGRRVWWDVCDPLHWFGPDDCRQIIDNADGIVASNKGLADDLAAWSGRPVHTIPDRLELDHFPKRRQHANVNPVKFIWYGLAPNRSSLFAAMPLLDRLVANGYDISLTIFDDRPEVQFAKSSSYPIYHVRWELDKENQVLAAHDIALLPPYPGEWANVKSNNKQLTAWANGLPVISDCQYNVENLDLVENHIARSMQAGRGYKEVLRHYQAKQSAVDWEALLCAS